MHIILVKKKQSVKQRNRPISGPIRSDPVIRPDPVNTRTPYQHVHKPIDRDFLANEIADKNNPVDSAKKKISISSEFLRLSRQLITLTVAGLNM